MKLTFTLFFAFGVFLSSGQQMNQDSVMVRQIYDEVLANAEAHDNLHYLCKEIGHRLSGSPQLEDAIYWGKELLENYGADNVFLQPVMVPKWTRGEQETAHMHVGEEAERIRITALGGSIGTGGTIKAPVIEVKYLEDLDTLGREAVEGKIVLFNRPMDPLLINTGMAYGGAYDQRSYGASKAAEYGAVGALVRSLTHAVDTFPHTGAMRYQEDIPRIPAAGISTVDARKIKLALKEGKEVEVSMNMNCVAYDDVEQFNVIAEIKGSEFPDEYIVVGGHLDSWDIGEGAHDDGAGIVQSIEVLRTLKALDYKPKRTIRVVLFINEENGNNGGKTYAAVAKDQSDFHFAAIESDSGGFSPRGFSIEGDDEGYDALKEWVSILEPYGIHVARRGWSGVDIRPLKNDEVLLFGLVPDNQRYFDYHHSNNDIWENVNRRELHLGAASMASLVYFLDNL
ncbi:M20/M25/M40 family metallo-hydrolase [Sanyastnella coralliicola]|uniref:M20/M25/M40 family metallo-hydrolase n=1 Tax=Sanyastnella coralliicola TaxID=3069118 RepID=UPI0027BA8A40|nr:M20/M25/M40 family metallo-hydrolase [Longitalea sp. SCSIO 12813]